MTTEMNLLGSVFVGGAQSFLSVLDWEAATGSAIFAEFSFLVAENVLSETLEWNPYLWNGVSFDRVTRSTPCKEWHHSFVGFRPILFQP